MLDFADGFRELKDNSLDLQFAVAWRRNQNVLFKSIVSSTVQSAQHTLTNLPAMNLQQSSITETSDDIGDVAFAVEETEEERMQYGLDLFKDEIHDIQLWLKDPHANGMGTAALSDECARIILDIQTTTAPHYVDCTLGLYDVEVRIFAHGGIQPLNLSPLLEK